MHYCPDCGSFLRGSEYELGVLMCHYCKREWREVAIDATSCSRTKLIRADLSPLSLFFQHMWSDLV